jgi:CheY-like chemotaxis protein
MKKYKILVVEDFEPSREVISEILEALGYAYKTADNGYEAVLILKSQDFDLVLMDIQMPLLNGFETTEHIRRNLKYPKNIIPIVAMTGWEHASDLNQTYKEENFDGIIEKPFSMEKLDETIKKYIERSFKKIEDAKPH